MTTKSSRPKEVDRTQATNQSRSIKFEQIKVHQPKSTNQIRPKTPATGCWGGKCPRKKVNYNLVTRQRSRLPFKLNQLNPANQFDPKHTLTAVGVECIGEKQSTKSCRYMEVEQTQQSKRRPFTNENFKLTVQGWPKTPLTYSWGGVHRRKQSTPQNQPKNVDRTQSANQSPPATIDNIKLTNHVRTHSCPRQSERSASTKHS